MPVTVTTTQSWGLRLGGSVKGIFVGIVLFILGFPVLFWNEGNAVRTMKALDEGEGACVAVESVEKVDPALEGKLVYANGKAVTDDVLKDDAFGVSAKALALIRTVEMYQWQEESTSEEKKNLGGSTTTTTTYDYKKVWSSRLIDSKEFKEAGHDNPAAMEFVSRDVRAANVRLGAYRLSESQVAGLGGAQAFAFPSDYTCRVARVQMNGGVIYVSNRETRDNEKNNRDAVAQPRIGDMRVTFKAILPHEVSLVARQHGDSFVAYTAKNGKKISLLRDGFSDASEMFAAARSSSSMMTWILRVVGFFMMFIGLSMVLRPLSVLADVLPFLGSLVGMGTGLLAFLVAFVCAFATAAVAWIVYRPVVGVVLLVVAALAVFLVVSKRKKAAALDHRT